MAEEEPTNTEVEDDSVQTQANTEQDGGQGDAQSDRFEDHKWESDEEWQLLLRGLDFGLLGDEKKKKYIEKRKHKYFKDNIDPSHEIPKIESRSRGTRYQAPPKTPTSNEEDANDNDAADTDNSTNANNNNEDETVRTEPKESESTQSNTNNSNSSNSTNSSSSRARTNNTRSRSQGVQLTPVQQLLNYFYVVSQWFIFINCLLSFVMPSSHYRALWGVIASHLVALFQNTGKPRFDMYYAQALFQDENVMIALYGLIFLMGPPIFVFLAPVALRSLHMGCFMLSAVLEQKLPSIHKQVHPLLKRVTSQYFWFLKNIALAEVAVGIFLIPACFFIDRTVILTLFYWQVMHGRYMMSQPIKNAFTIVNQKLESLFGRVPAVLNIYRKITAFLYDRVDPVKMQEQMRQQQSGEGAGSGLGSMLNKCNIM